MITSELGRGQLESWSRSNVFLPRRTLAIGNIHGSLRAFDALVEAVSPTADDVIITLGDYIDRVSDSAGVLDRLIQLSTTHHLIPLRGNHEEMMLDARREPELLQLWRSCGGRAALHSYGIAEDSPDLLQVPPAHWHFVDHTCRDLYETADHFYVHGGVDAGLPLDRQTPAVLHWTPFPPGRPHLSGKMMVCGHTPQMSGVPAVLPHAVCIDTGAGHGGWLTCLDMGSGDIWQANESGEVRESVLGIPRRG